jgi:hypothetical protein
MIWSEGSLMAPNSKNYDEYQFIRTKSTWKPNFPQIGGFLYFGGHMVQHVLLPVNIHFHWNLFIFEFLTIYFDFILEAILKILKSKSTTLSDDLFLCQVSKGSAVRSEYNIFCTLVTIATVAILNFLNPQKLPHTTVDIPTKFHKVWWKESNNFLNPPFFVSMATATKFVQPIPNFLAYLVPLDVDVVPIKFHQFLFGE